MKQKNNFRDLVIGSLGWFVVGNIAFPLFFLFILYNWSNVVGIYGFGILTVVTIGFLVYKKRNWLALGIVAALTTNAVAWKIYLIGAKLFVFAEVLTIPLPIGLSLLKRTLGF